MTSYIEAADLPEGEKVYLKKDFLGWRVVEPIREEDGKINVFKLIFGSRRMLFQLLIYLLILTLLYFGIKELLLQYQDIAINPCKYCTSSLIKFGELR